MKPARTSLTTPLVLVVADEEETYLAISGTLEKAGFRVVGADNGIDAVDSAVKLLPDLLLMDLSLPIMGGCEAARLLKSDSRTTTIPIIAIAGHHNFLSVSRESGCDGCLTAPYTDERLLAVAYAHAGPVLPRRSMNSSELKPHFRGN